MDELYESALKIKRNYYIGKADVLELPFIWSLDLPGTFEFTEADYVQGVPIYQKPTVTAAIGSESISVDVVDKPRLQDIDKTTVVPTRLDAERLLVSFNDVVVPETAIVLLGDVVVNDSFLSELGHVYVEIDNATQFGEILADNTVVSPKVIIKGTPWLEDEPQEEHIGFRTNGERISVDRWDEIDSIETHGIFDAETTLRAHSGFSKRAVKEPLAFWEDSLRETLLIYTVENALTPGYNILPVIQFKAPEITNASLRQQGLGDDIIEYEMAVMIDSDTYIPKSVVGLERMPFSRWFLLATEDKLYTVSARMSHPFNYISEDEHGSNIISDGLKARSPGAELNILYDRNWINYAEDGTEFTIETRHAKPVRGIKSTRLSITWDSPGLSAPVTKYYDWSGNEMDITTDLTQGFIFNSSSNASATDWDEKHLTFDATDITDHPAWVAVIKLEAKMTDNVVEADVFILHSDVRYVDGELDWPEDIKGKVNGITYDAKGRLLARTIDNEVWTVNMYWDYCIVDYKRGTVFLREEYDSVEVTS
jgi:hypothetical protein